jgi:hypothetical protein
LVEATFWLTSSTWITPPTTAPPLVPVGSRWICAQNGLVA